MAFMIIKERGSNLHSGKTQGRLHSLVPLRGKSQSDPLELHLVIKSIQEGFYDKDRQMIGSKSIFYAFAWSRYLLYWSSYFHSYCYGWHPCQVLSAPPKSSKYAYKLTSTFEQFSILYIFAIASSFSWDKPSFKKGIQIFSFWESNKKKKKIGKSHFFYFWIRETYLYQCQ